MRKKTPPVSLVPASSTPPPDPTAARRAVAFERAWFLLGTSIPTEDILGSYLDDVLS